LIVESIKGFVSQLIEIE